MLQGVLSNAERHTQMAQAKGVMLKKKTHFNSKWATIVCYGPSLADTWTQIKRPIVSVSGGRMTLIWKIEQLQEECFVFPEQPSSFFSFE